jgi:squalene-associated FAD-dependent desaturase
MKIAIVGGGWAGMAAAVHATHVGHSVHVFEAAKTLGGRARALDCHLPDGTPVTLDNGQHILIGAYTDTLRLIQQVGLQPDQVLLRLPLNLTFPDGSGLRLPQWPAPLDAVAGIMCARGWSLADKWSLVKAALLWQWQRFECSAQTSVADLCQGISSAVFNTLIEPLCVSALNTPANRASGQVFLRVLQDSLFGGRGSSNLLLPTVDLTQLFPQAAALWLQQHGGTVTTGCRVDGLSPTPQGWRVAGEAFDAVVWATSSSVAAQVLAASAQHMQPAMAASVRPWAATTQALQFESIATVYAYASDARLRQPMLALHSSTAQPAQFVFDRGQLGGPAGVLAFVVSASNAPREVLQSQVLQQAQQQLGLSLQVVQTVVEKRATFACTPGLLRPAAQVAPKLLVCGDYVQGPYPATLEGAVRSGVSAINQLL